MMAIDAIIYFVGMIIDYSITTSTIRSFPFKIYELQWSYTIVYH